MEAKIGLEVVLTVCEPALGGDRLGKEISGRFPCPLEYRRRNTVASHVHESNLGQRLPHLVNDPAGLSGTGHEWRDIHNGKIKMGHPWGTPRKRPVKGITRLE